MSGFPNINSPLVDPKSGNIQPVWRSFLASLWTSLGGPGAGPVAPAAGNENQAFQVAAAASGGDAVNLTQANDLYAPIAGNQTQPFNVGNAAAGSNNALRRSQAELLFAPIAGAGGDQFAVASGADTITATFGTAPTLVDGLQLKVRAAAANATTTPTFNPNSLGALSLTKLGGVALAAGDIYGAGHELIIRYRASPERYELVTPSPGSGTIPAPSAWIAPTLTNSWVNYGGAFAPAGYYKDQIGIVHLRGLLKSGTASSAAFTLPAGYRPQYELYFKTVGNATVPETTVTAAGVVTPLNGTAYAGLDGISFLAYS